MFRTTWALVWRSTSVGLSRDATPSSCRRGLSQAASEAPVERLTYSDFVEDFVTVSCRLLYQIIAEPAIVKQNPPVDLRVLGQAAQSASVNPCTTCSPLG
jgi:hypothetical protein